MSPPPRLHRVRSPDARAETWAVARALFHVLYWSALVVSAETSTAAGAARASVEPSPYERRFQDLASVDQRVYRSLEEGIVEAERIRSTTGRWPGVEEMARAGIPPFTRDPLDTAGFTWVKVETGLKVDYVGTPRPGSGRESMFAIIVEPDPGDPKDPSAPVDEIHHRLGDGTMIHVTVWMGPPVADMSEAFSLLPPERGYRQVIAITPRP